MHHSAQTLRSESLFCTVCPNHGLRWALSGFPAREARHEHRVFDWFARESLRAAEHAEDPRQREILLKLAVLWEAAAQRSRDEASPQSTPPNTDERAHSEDDRAA